MHRRQRPAAGVERGVVVGREVRRRRHGHAQPVAGGIRIARRPRSRARADHAGVEKRRVRAGTERHARLGGFHHVGVGTGDVDRVAHGALAGHAVGFNVARPAPAQADQRQLGLLVGHEKLGGRARGRVAGRQRRRAVGKERGRERAGVDIRREVQRGRHRRHAGVGAGKHEVRPDRGRTDHRVGLGPARGLDRIAADVQAGSHRGDVVLRPRAGRRVGGVEGRAAGGQAHHGGVERHRVGTRGEVHVGRHGHGVGVAADEHDVRAGGAAALQREGIVARGGGIPRPGREGQVGARLARDLEVVEEQREVRIVRRRARGIAAAIPAEGVDGLGVEDVRGVEQVGHPVRGAGQVHLDAGGGLGDAHVHDGAGDVFRGHRRTEDLEGVAAADVEQVGVAAAGPVEVHAAVAAVPVIYETEGEDIAGLERRAEVALAVAPAARAVAHEAPGIAVGGIDVPAAAAGGVAQLGHFVPQVPGGKPRAEVRVVGERGGRVVPRLVGRLQAGSPQRRAGQGQRPDQQSAQQLHLHDSLPTGGFSRILRRARDNLTKITHETSKNVTVKRFLSGPIPLPPPCSAATAW